MTINSTTRKAGPFIGNGSTSAFPFSFKVFQASDLEVVRLDTATNTETSLVLTSDYTVTLNLDQDSNPGGTVTLLAGALAAGYTLTLTSDLPNLQPTDLTNQGGFYPDVINDALDRSTIQIQQLQEQTDRSLKVSVSSTVDTTLPPPVANDLIGWSSTGDALVNIDPTSIATVVTYATAYADVFLGNGVTTSWTLTRNPAVLYNLDVSINGSTQEPTRDYTFASTVITFTTAPPLGSRVLVKYKEGLPNYEGDSQDVRFVPDGANAVTRSVQSKLREWVSVKDFGAVGDGVHDDALAINRATKYVANLGGGTVYYPPGTYRITRAIRLDDYDIETFTYSGNVRENMVHQGAGRGATRIVADGFWTSIFTSFPEPFLASNAVQPELLGPGTPGADQYVFLGRNIVIDGFTLDCNYDVNVDGGAAYGVNYGSWGGTWPNGSTGPSTWACDNYQYPIYVYNCADVKVSNCDVVNSWYNGIEVYRCYGFIIESNVIEHCGDKANYFGYYSGVELDNATIRAIVNGNTFKACGNGIMSNGDMASYVWQPVSQVVISNNLFDNMTQNGMYIFDYLEEWTIIGNKIHGCGGSGIQIALNATPVAGRNPQWMQIIGNSVIGFNSSNGSGACGIRALGGEVVCSNNIVRTNSNNTANTWGIIAANPGTTPPSNGTYGVVVSNNTVTGMFTGADQISGGGILAGATNTVVSNNIINSMWDGVSANRVWTAIMIGADNVVVEGNNITGNYYYGSGKLPIVYFAGTKPEVRDGKYGPYLNVKTGAGRSGVSGWQVVDFTNYTPTLNYVECVWNTTSNAFYSQIPGLYHVEYMVNFNGIGTAASPVGCTALIEKNAFTSISASGGLIAGSGSLTGTAVVELNFNDYIQLKSYSASGTYTVDSSTYMRVTLLRPLY